MKEMANQVTAESAGGPSSVVVYHTRYGNTKKIAESLEIGIKEAGVRTVCVDTRDMDANALKQYDLICVGAPTEGFSASKPMKEFLGKLKSIDLSGKYCFAFDTKLDCR